MKFKTKVPDFCGIIATVRFVDGIGETDKPRLIEWFKENGYEVVDDVPVEEFIPTTKQEMEIAEEHQEKPYAESLEDMSVSEIREWMKSNGINPMNIQNKEKLLARLHKIRG